MCVASHPAVGVLSSAHTLQHGLVEPQLQTGLVEHLPLVAVPGDQTVDLDRLRLADTMTSGLGLEEDAFTRVILPHILFTFLLSPQENIQLEM